MPLLLDDTTSTDAGAAVTIGRKGAHKLLASIPTGDEASIAIEERIDSDYEWVPLAGLSGTQVALTVTAPSAVVYARSGQQLRAIRTGGTEAVSASVDYIG